MMLFGAPATLRVANLILPSAQIWTIGALLLGIGLVGLATLGQFCPNPAVSGLDSTEAASRDSHLRAKLSIALRLFRQIAGYGWLLAVLGWGLRLTERAQAETSSSREVAFLKLVADPSNIGFLLLGIILVRSRGCHLVTKTPIINGTTNRAKTKLKAWIPSVGLTLGTALSRETNPVLLCAFLMGTALCSFAFVRRGSGSENVVWATKVKCRTKTAANSEPAQTLSGDAGSTNGSSFHRGTPNDSSVLTKNNVFSKSREQLSLAICVGAVLLFALGSLTAPTTQSLAGVEPSNANVATNHSSVINPLSRAVGSNEAGVQSGAINQVEAQTDRTIGNSQNEKTPESLSLAEPNDLNTPNENASAENGSEKNVSVEVPAENISAIDVESGAVERVASGVSAEKIQANSEPKDGDGDTQVKPSTLPDPKGEALDNDAISSVCSKAGVVKGLCYERALAAVLRKNGVRPMLRQLSALVRVDTDALSSCHENLHNLGKLAVELADGILRDVATQATGECGSGFIHGAISERLAGYTSDQLPKEMAKICGSNLNDAADFAIGSCLHGLGHAALLVKKDVTESLNLCDALSPVSAQSPVNTTLSSGLALQPSERCAAGVFMQNVTNLSDRTTRSIVKFKVDDPQYPCNTVSLSQQNACYAVQYMLFAAVSGEVDKQATAKKVCEGAPAKHREICYNGFGSVFAADHPTNPQIVAQSCMETPSTDPQRLACVGGGAGTYGLYDVTKKYSIAFCGAVKSSFQTPCKQTIDEMAKAGQIGGTTVDPSA